MPPVRNLDHTPTPTAGAIALPSIPDPPSAVVPPSTAGGAGKLGGGDEHRSVPALVQVALRGELDIDSAPRVRSELAAAVESGAPTVLVDLHDVTFMDSSGLSALVAAGQALAARGASLYLEGASGAVRQVLEITALLDRYRQPEAEAAPAT